MRRSERRKALRLWMLSQELKASDISRDLGLSGNTIYQWLYGNFKSNRIADYFASRGCPAEIIVRSSD